MSSRGPQLPLFPVLPVVVEPPKPTAVRRAASPKPRAWTGWQFEMDLQHEVGTSDYPVRLFTQAATAPLPVTTGTRSVFDLAMASAAEVLAEILEEPEQTPWPAFSRPAVTRDGGVTRCEGAQYPANRWTDEREEQERARRARQKPPKPPKQRFKMKNSKEWEGG